MYQFPATDFHELNLDWMLQQIKAITAEWGTEQTNLETWKTNTTAFIDAYLAEHCSDTAIRARVSEELAEMVQDGTLLTLLQEPVTTEVTSWLAARLVGSEYPIDRSFTLENAAPDAMLTGQAIGAAQLTINDSGYIYKSGVSSADYVDVDENGPVLITTQAGYKHLLIDVSEQVGQLYTVAASPIGPAVAGMLLLRADGYILDRIATYQQSERKAIKIPNNAKWLYVSINTNTTGRGRSNHIYNGAYCPYWFEILESRIAALEAAAPASLTMNLNRIQEDPGRLLDLGSVADQDPEEVQEITKPITVSSTDFEDIQTE